MIYILTMKTVPNRYGDSEFYTKTGELEELKALAHMKLESGLYTEANITWRKGIQKLKNEEWKEYE